MDIERAPDAWLKLTHSESPYWRGGSGPDLVFVHGWPLDGRTWRDVVTHLCADFTCHVFDLPFAGRSAWTDETPSDVDAFTSATVEAIEAMDLRDGFGLVGHDSGGTFARLAAAKMPERITGIALGNTEIPGYHSLRMKALLEAARVDPLNAAFRALLGTKIGRVGAFRDCVRDLDYIERELTPRFIAPMRDSERAFAGAMKLVQNIRIEDFDLLALAHPRITAPVHHVWGGSDAWFPLTECREMLSSYGGEATLTVLDGYKLFVHEEAAAQFAAEVSSFFQEVAG